jgi:predicted nucleotide-binding protein
LGLFQAKKPKPSFSRRVFVVHGHDDDLKDSVADHISSLGLDPVVLHREPDMGRTVIEKFEAYSDVGFAVCILTPDDPMSNGAMRARQNVIMELGYLTGKLGRSRVCALKKGHLEVPSDIVGVLYKSVDDSGKWKRELQQELVAAGLVHVGFGTGRA